MSRRHVACEKRVPLLFLLRWLMDESVITSVCPIRVTGLRPAAYLLKGRGSDDTHVTQIEATAPEWGFIMPLDKIILLLLCMSLSCLMFDSSATRNDNRNDRPIIGKFSLRAYRKSFLPFTQSHILKLSLFILLKVFWLKMLALRSRIEPLTSLPLMWSSWSPQERESYPSCELFINHSCRAQQHV